MQDNAYSIDSPAANTRLAVYVPIACTLSPFAVIATAATPLDDWRRTLEVNLTGAWLLSRSCLPVMTAAGRGVMNWLIRRVPVTDQLHGARFFVREDDATGMSACGNITLKGTKTPWSHPR